MATAMLTPIPSAQMRPSRPSIKPMPPRNSAAMARRPSGLGIPSVRPKYSSVGCKPAPPNQPSAFCAPCANITAPRTTLIANSMGSSGVCRVRFSALATQPAIFFTVLETAHIFDDLPFMTSRLCSQVAAQRPAAVETLFLAPLPLRMRDRLGKLLLRRGAEQRFQVAFLDRLFLHQSLHDLLQNVSPALQNLFHPLVGGVHDPPDLRVDLFGGAFAIVAFFARQPGFQIAGLPRLSIGQISEPVAHPEPRNHLPGQRRGAL